MTLTLSGFSFQAIGKRHPLEDRFLCDWPLGTIAVSDGVSRPAYQDKAAVEESARVGEAALAFCQAAMELVEAHGRAGISVAMQRTGEEANRRIAVLNQSLGFTSSEDYTERDPYAAVGVCGALDPRGCWHFGYIGDSALFHFAPSHNVSRLGEDQLIGTRRVLESLEHLPPNERLQFLRHHLRNQWGSRDPLRQPAGYGVLNGDPHALLWWTTGSVPAQPGDLFVGCTDGAEALVSLPGFERLLEQFRQSRNGDQAAAGCRELWEEATRENAEADDATIVAALVDGAG